MPQGLLITIPIGTNQGIITNVFVRINAARIYPSTGGQSTDLNVYAYPSQASYATDPGNTLVVSKLPPIILLPAFPIASLNNVPNVADFLYGVLEAAIEAVTGPGTVTIVP